jgi:hypothetical protein
MIKTSPSPIDSRTSHDCSKCYVEIGVGDQFGSNNESAISSQLVGLVILNVFYVLYLLRILILSPWYTHVYLLGVRNFFSVKIESPNFLFVIIHAQTQYIVIYMVFSGLLRAIITLISFPFVIGYGIILGLLRYNTKVFKPTPATRYVPKKHVRVDNLLLKPF